VALNNTTHIRKHITQQSIIRPLAYSGVMLKAKARTLKCLNSPVQMKLTQNIVKLLPVHSWISDL